TAGRAPEQRVTTPEPAPLARRVGADEAFFDYTRVPYQPVRASAGKWSSSFVLEAALEAAGAVALKAPMRALGAALGVDATVGGAKPTAAGSAWELPLYDSPRGGARLGVAAPPETIGPPGSPDAPKPAGATPRRHFMVSVDLSTEPAAAPG